jgi:NADH-quinone oxidoreductase subunit H
MAFTLFIPLLFCAAGIILINRTLNLKEIVGSQYQYWNIVFQPLGFIAAVTSVLMQLKLLGFTRRNKILYSENSEKEGNGFGGLISRVARYSIMFFLIMLIVLLYLAGWERLYFINGNIMFAVKFYILFFILLFIDRATPKLDDYFYLKSINSRFVVPISAVNFLLTMVFFILRNIYNLI